MIQHYFSKIINVRNKYLITFGNLNINMLKEILINSSPSHVRWNAALIVELMLYKASKGTGISPNIVRKHLLMVILQGRFIAWVILLFFHIGILILELNVFSSLYWFLEFLYFHYCFNLIPGTILLFYFYSPLSYVLYPLFCKCKYVS